MLREYMPTRTQKRANIVFLASTAHQSKFCFKHVFSSIYVFFTLFGYWAHGGEGGLSQGIGVQCAYAFFHPEQLKNRSF